MLQSPLTLLLVLHHYCLWAWTSQWLCLKTVCMWLVRVHETGIFVVCKRRICHMCVAVHTTFTLVPTDIIRSNLWLTHAVFPISCNRSRLCNSYQTYRDVTAVVLRSLMQRKTCGLAWESERQTTVKRKMTLWSSFLQSKEEIKNLKRKHFWQISYSKNIKLLFAVYSTDINALAQWHLDIFPWVDYYTMKARCRNILAVSCHIVHSALPAAAAQSWGSFPALTQEKNHLEVHPLYHPISVYWLNFLLTLVLPLHLW